ncbi:MAG: AzlC family ABC transporter permease [Anaerolineales bacterium]|nr:AzlC family ABC transporter permease [Anaerolineales bacterium]
MPSRLSEFLSGVKAELPILVGVMPFGAIFGLLALDAGMSKLAAQCTSWIVFAGSAQIVMTQLVGAGAPGAVIVLTVFVVNLRHALYSASVAPYLRRLSPAWKWLLAYLLTDEAYAVSIVHYSRTSEASFKGEPTARAGAGDRPADIRAAESLESGAVDHRHYFLLGSGLALWATWQASTALGVFLGAVLPPSWSLDFTLALTFIALVVPALGDRAGLAAAFSAGIVAVLAFDMPYKLGLVSAALVGILVGLLVEARK